MLDLPLLRLIPTFKTFREVEVVSDATVIGWHSHLVLDSEDVLGSGTHSDRSVARQIALAESLERITFKKIAKDHHLNKKFFLHKYPSSSGFAAGFDREKSRFRSLCEAVERWAWSNWIDKKNHLPQVKIDTENVLSMLALHFTKVFEKYSFYSIPIRVDSLDNPLIFAVFIGETVDGVFAGSRVSGHMDENLWDHPIIESWRNYSNYNLLKGTSSEKNIIAERAMFFGANKGVALEAIERAKGAYWPELSIHFQLEYESNSDFFLWRTLCNKFVPWTDGDERRFVY